MNLEKIVDGLSFIETGVRIDSQLQKTVLERTKREYRNMKLTFIIGTVVVIGICIGVMYLRFRIIGG